MRVFLAEKAKWHWANLGRLYKRHKAGIGYVILLVGVVIALVGVVRAQNESAYQNAKTRAVICLNTIANDRQQLTNLITKSGHELLHSFNLTLPQAAALIHKNLEATAKERKNLQPSNPTSACTSKFTTLRINPPKVDKESEQALKTATAGLSTQTKAPATHKS